MRPIPTNAIGGLLLSLALVLASGAPARAADQDVVDRVSALRIEALLVELGYTGSRVDEDGDLFVPMQGYNVLMLVGSYDGAYVAMVAAFADTDATLQDVNVWNQEKRFARAYLDTDGDPVIEAELDLAGGVTIARVKDFIRTFGQLSLPEFVQTVAVAR